MVSSIVITLDADYDTLIGSTVAGSLREDIEEEIASNLGVAPERVNVTSVTRGSVIIAFSVEWAVSSLVEVNRTVEQFKEAVYNGTVILLITSEQGEAQLLMVADVDSVAHAEVVVAAATAASPTACPFSVKTCSCKEGQTAKIVQTDDGCSECQCLDEQGATEAPASYAAYLWGPLGTLIAVTVLASALALFCYVTRKPRHSWTPHHRSVDQGESAVAVGMVVQAPDLSACRGSSVVSLPTIASGNTKTDCPTPQAMGGPTDSPAHLCLPGTNLAGSLRSKHRWWDATPPGTTSFGAEATTIIMSPATQISGLGEYLDSSDLTGVPRDVSSRLSLTPQALSRSLPSLSEPVDHGVYFESTRSASRQQNAPPGSLLALDQAMGGGLAKTPRLFHHEDQTPLDTSNWMLSSHRKTGASEVWETPQPVPRRTTVRRSDHTMTVDNASISSLADSIRSECTQNGHNNPRRERPRILRKGSVV